MTTALIVLTLLALLVPGLVRGVFALIGFAMLALIILAVVHP